MDTDRLTQSLSQSLSGQRSWEQLIGDLRTYPELAIFDRTWQCHGYGGVQCEYRFLANWMLTKGRIIGATEVVSNLSRYVVSESIPYHEVMVLAGVNLESEIRLSGGVELAPFDRLRHTDLKEILTRRFVNVAPNYLPSAYLQRPVSYPREHVDWDATPVCSKVRWDTSFSSLEDVRLCMTAVGPSAPLWLSSWIQPDDWVPDFGGGGMNAPELFDMGGCPPEIASQWEELPELHRQWLELSESERKHLRVALRRINSALRQREVVDRAIDLGVAIDALFLSEREPERGELGFTLRVRAGWYLGSDQAHRREVSKAFSDLWSLRNMAVHTGRLAPGGHTLDLLRSGSTLTAKAIRKIIREGEPDWKTIIFG